MWNKNLILFGFLCILIHVNAQRSTSTTTQSTPAVETTTSSTTPEPSTPEPTTQSTSPSSTTQSSTTEASTSPSPTESTSPSPTEAATSTSTQSTTTQMTETTTTGKPKVCEKPGLTCLDCRTLQVCNKAGDESPLYNITCSDQTNKLRTYCDTATNECVKASTCSSASTPEALVECTQTGLRPDPKDCHRYVQCIKSTTTSSGYVGYTVDCPEGLRYSSSQERCISSLTCPNIRNYCTGTKRKMVAYKPYPSIYGLCPGNKGDDIIISLCKGKYQFVESAGSCQPVCTSAENIPSNENCKQYYTCQGTLFGYSMKLNTCPTGFGFNVDTGLCDETKANCIAIGTKTLIPNPETVYETFFGSN